MYVMQTCPDCEYVEKQVEGNPNFKVIDIGKHVRNLKEFLKLRDTHPAFNEAKAVDDLGIPCYVLEDGTVTLYSKDVGLEPRPQEEGASCSIDGRGCWVSNNDDLTVNKRKKTDALRRLMNIPESETVMAVIALGYRDAEPNRPERRNLDEILKFF